MGRWAVLGSVAQLEMLPGTGQHAIAIHAMAVTPFPPPPARTGIPANNALLLNRLDDFQASAADIFIGDQVLDTLVMGEGSVEDHGVGTVELPLP